MKARDIKMHTKVRAKSEPCTGRYNNTLLPSIKVTGQIVGKTDTGVYVKMLRRYAEAKLKDNPEWDYMIMRIDDIPHSARNNSYDMFRGYCAFFTWDEIIAAEIGFEWEDVEDA